MLTNERCSVIIILVVTKTMANELSGHRVPQVPADLLRKCRWLLGQAVKTPASHAGNAGSIPAGVTNQPDAESHRVFFALCLIWFRARSTAFLQRFVTLSPVDEHSLSAILSHARPSMYRSTNISRSKSPFIVGIAAIAAFNSA